MIQRRIGDTSVSAIGLGGATWSLAERVDIAAAEATIEAALEAGVTWIDTAAAYTTADEAAHNEKLIARTLRRLGRDDVLVSTKGGHYRSGSVWPIDGRPETIRRHCEASLEALGVESLPLYFLHWPDPEVDFATSIGTLEELRREGKVQRTGASNVSSDQLDIALSVTPLSAIQNTFSPFNTADRGLIARCEQLGVAYTVYSPLGGPRRSGSLSGALPATARLADELGHSVQQLVLAWELSLSEAVIPVSGATRPESIRSSAASADLIRSTGTSTPETVTADGTTASSIVDAVESDLKEFAP